MNSTLEEGVHSLAGGDRLLSSCQLVCKEKFLHQILIAKSGSFLQTSLFVWRTFSPVFWYFDLDIIIIFVWLVHCQAHKQAKNRPKELVFRYYGKNICTNFYKVYKNNGGCTDKKDEDMLLI